MIEFRLKKKLLPTPPVDNEISYNVLTGKMEVRDEAFEGIKPGMVILSFQDLGEGYVNQTISNFTLPNGAKFYRKI